MQIFIQNIIQYWWYFLPFTISFWCIAFLYSYAFSDFTSVKDPKDLGLSCEFEFRDKLNLGLLFMAPFSIFPVINIGVVVAAIYFTIQALKYQKL